MTTDAPENPRPETRLPTVAEWKALVAEYQKPCVWHAVWQLVETIGPSILLWYLIYRSFAVSWWLVVPLPF